jgi:ABC-type bacteriocin/lantibiotic exporter with double-glycine peptidase domain
MRRRGVFGLVPQEVFLLNNSLRENLLLGRRDIDDKRLIQILQKCNLFNLNNSKINLNEILGFGGRLLSGGEKQRLGLARALLGNPEVLILDESTSALDESSKSVFMNLIENLKKERIIIMVSHDNSLKRYFDEVYELSNGSIHRVESIG